MKGNLFEEHYSQLENRITEAFIKVFKHATSELTDSFLQFVGLNGQYGDYSYDFQTTNDVHMNTDIAVLVGIAETDQIILSGSTDDDFNEEDEEQEGIPDAFLHARIGSMTILFEMKRGGGKLHRRQLNAHKRKFVGIHTEEVRELILTWKSVCDFFKIERTRYQGIHRNALLLDSFDQFCKIHMVGEERSDVTYDRYIARYEGRKFEVVNSLSIYALSLEGVIPQASNGAVEYKYPATAKPFFTIWLDRDWIIFKPKSPFGLHLDLLTAKLFGRNLETIFDSKSQESFLHIDWIESDEQLAILKDMIKYAYENKNQKVTISAMAFVRNYDIKMVDYLNSRLGRPDQSWIKYQPKVEEERGRILSALRSR